MTILYLIAAFLAFMAIFFGLLDGVGAIPQGALDLISSGMDLYRGLNYYFPVQEELTFLLFAFVVNLVMWKLQGISFVHRVATNSATPHK